MRGSPVSFVILFFIYTIIFIIILFYIIIIFNSQARSLELVIPIDIQGRAKLMHMCKPILKPWVDHATALVQTS